MTAINLRETFSSPFSILSTFSWGRVDYEHRGQRVGVVKLEEKVEVAASTETNDLSVDLSQQEMTDLFYLFTKMLLRTKRLIPKLTKEQAFLSYKEIEPFIEPLLSIDEDIAKIECDDQVDFKFYMSIKGFSTSAFEVINMLKIISEGQDIDEDSEDFKAYLNNLVSKGMKSPRVKVANSINDLFQ